MDTDRKPTDGLDGGGGGTCVSVEIPTADGVGRCKGIPTAPIAKHGRLMVDAQTKNDAKNKVGWTISQTLKKNAGK